MAEKGLEYYFPTGIKMYCDFFLFYQLAWLHISAWKARIASVL